MGASKFLGANLSILSRGSLNTPRRFIPQKPDKSAGTDEPSGSPNYDWGQTFFFKQENVLSIYFFHPIMIFYNILYAFPIKLQNNNGLLSLANDVTLDHVMINNTFGGLAPFLEKSR